MSLPLPSSHRAVRLQSVLKSPFAGVQLFLFLVYLWVALVILVCLIDLSLRILKIRPHGWNMKQHIQTR